MRTAVALGSNLGDRLGNLRAARKAIVDLAGVQLPVLSSA
ncbi:MAG: 2-amino-4-hydroxy-6-hydroxymethyldihydropteridine diphosphokinase, partial [Verrucomicrobia bacterium]